MKLKQMSNHPLSISKKKKKFPWRPLKRLDPESLKMSHPFMRWTVTEEKCWPRTCHLRVRKQPEARRRRCRWAWACFWVLADTGWPMSWGSQGDTSLCVPIFLLVWGLMGEWGCHGFIMPQVRNGDMYSLPSHTCAFWASLIGCFLCCTKTF